jgi:hypothetical protein
METMILMIPTQRIQYPITNGYKIKVIKGLNKSRIPKTKSRILSMRMASFSRAKLICAEEEATWRTKPFNNRARPEYFTKYT